MVLHNFTHRLNAVMCVCVFVHTGVTLIFITEHKEAVEHSGCAERYIRPPSNRDRTLHVLLSSSEPGQRNMTHSLDPTKYSPHRHTRCSFSSISTNPSTMRSSTTAVQYSCVQFSSFCTAHTLLFALLSNTNWILLYPK